ncbi:MAG: uracil-DNA glycosylase [Pseudomonadota bacterium]
MGLDAIAREIRECTRCPLHESRTCAVPGEGPADARIMLVGEAPGREEDIRGRPFIGRAGKILDEALQGAGLKREALFITSVVKCRPPHNRTPHKHEIETCVATHLQRQIKAIQPDIVCLLGRVAAGALLGEARLFVIRGRLFRRDRLYIPTTHPAAAGRNPAWRKALAEDLALLHSLVNGGPTLLPRN